jgi:hypothetical protein
MGARLACLERLCTNLAGGINTARNALREGAEDTNIAFLVADALDRLGWMADQAAVVAGSEIPPVVGDADSWILCGAIQQLKEHAEAQK